MRHNVIRWHNVIWWHNVIKWHNVIWWYNVIWWHVIRWHNVMWWHNVIWWHLKSPKFKVLYCIWHIVDGLGGDRSNQYMRHFHHVALWVVLKEFVCLKYSISRSYSASNNVSEFLLVMKVIWVEKVYSLIRRMLISFSVYFVLSILFWLLLKSI